MPEYRNLTLHQIQTLAARIAKKDTSKGIVIGLIGNLGSGKTTFAKNFAKSLGIKSVKSPTFIISQRYPLKKSRFLYHIDFYRLETRKDLEAIGLDEMLSADNIVLIEWVDKFPQIKRKCDIFITFKVKPQNKRDVTVQTN